MSDDDDYMSLKFLEEAQEYESKRKETTYSERRKKQIREQERKSYIKPRAQLEEEERQKGLERSMDESNKGMKMLMKMGFKKGMSLGNDGIREPIKVDLKSGRGGIGMENELKKRAREQEEEEERERKKTAIDPEDFRAAMAQRMKESKLIRYLTAAVSICQKLDEENNVQSNILWILRPTQKEQDDDEPKTEEDPCKEEQPKEEDESCNFLPEQVEELKSLTIEQQLYKVLEYLRNNYLYCFWCSAKYENKNDLDESCPGLEEDDH